MGVKTTTSGYAWNREQMFFPVKVRAVSVQRLVESKGRLSAGQAARSRFAPDVL